MSGIVILVPQPHGSVRVYVTNQRACIHMIEETTDAVLAGPVSKMAIIEKAIESARQLPDPFEEWGG